MIFCKNEKSDTPILELYDIIGKQEDGTGISGTEFADYLKFIESQEGKKRIDVYICSLGGSIIDGLIIHSAIKSCTIPVNTVCVGVAVSIAGIILQAGNRRQITKSGIFMMHDPSGGAVKELDKFKEQLITLLTERSGLTAEEAGTLMSDETWYNPTECLEKKLVDEIVDITSPAQMPDTKELKNLASKGVYNRLKNIVNELKIETPNKMKKLINFFNLDDSASENEVLAEVKGLQKASNAGIKAVKAAKATLNSTMNKKDEDSEDTYDDLKKTVADMKAAYDKVCEDKNTVDTENKKLKDEIENLKNAGSKKEAEDAVNAAISAGKIKAEIKDTFVDMYVANADETKKILAAMNGTKAGAHMNVNGKLPQAKKEGEPQNIAGTEGAKPLASFFRAKREAFEKKENENRIANKK